MPHAAPRYCTEPGCKRFAYHGQRCGPCKAMREEVYERVRGSAAQRGYDAKWRAVRAYFLDHNPWCQGSSCGAAATDMDHIVPKSQGGTDDWSNLQGLCHACHSRKTRGGM